MINLPDICGKLNNAEISISDIDVNTKVHGGYTLLHVAVILGYFNVLSLLITNGAKIDAQDDAAQTPLYKAVDFFRGDVSIKCIKFLIENGANPTIKTLDNKSPADLAKKKGNISLYKYLNKTEVDFIRSKLNPDNLEKEIKNPFRLVC